MSHEGKTEKGRTFPTYCMSVPVYSSNKKNWFHIQPRLERRRGTPLASCPVSPVDPLRPPVVLRRALRPHPGELRWATVHSSTKTQTFLLSMAAPPQPRARLSTPTSVVCVRWLSVKVSDQSSCCRRLKQDGKQHLERLHGKIECQYWEERKQFVRARALVLFHNPKLRPMQLSHLVFLKMQGF